MHSKYYAICPQLLIHQPNCSDIKEINQDWIKNNGEKVWAKTVKMQEMKFDFNLIY